MTSRRAVTILAGAAALALTAPAASQAATRTVAVGLPPSAAKPFDKLGADVNDFFPHGVTIRAGDSLRFAIAPDDFHTVDLPAKGQGLVPLITPTGKAISGVLDAAGAPFWFNGQPELNFNAALGTPTWGTTATFDGSARVDSGLPVPPPVKPLTVKFAKTGSYTFFCDVHPGMKGVVHVVAHHARVPSARARARILKRQLRRDLSIAKRLRRAKVTGNDVHLGQAGPHGVEIFAMFPATKTITAGTTLTFRMSPGTFEVHTATFGPGPPTAAGTYLGQLAASLQSPRIDQRVLYPSDNPMLPLPALTPALHGNGFWNSGALDRTPATPLPSSNAVTFGKPGTYDYYCLIHPFMHGVVVVQ